jgi:hypothetical protein
VGGEDYSLVGLQGLRSPHSLTLSTSVDPFDFLEDSTDKLGDHTSVSEHHPRLRKNVGLGMMREMLSYRLAGTSKLEQPRVHHLQGPVLISVGH